MNKICPIFGDCFYQLFFLPVFFFFLNPYKTTVPQEPTIQMSLNPTV